MTKVPAEHFVATIAANVNNNKLTDEAFREFIRNTLPIVDFPAPQRTPPTYEEAWPSPTPGCQ